LKHFKNSHNQIEFAIRLTLANNL
jgi:hypothetical protein